MNPVCAGWRPLPSGDLLISFYNPPTVLLNPMHTILLSKPIFLFSRISPWPVPWFSLQSDLKKWHGMLVFDDFDVFNGPCQTDSLVAYLDWHMDSGCFGHDLLPIRLKGAVRSAWASSAWYIDWKQSSGQVSGMILTSVGSWYSLVNKT